MVLRHKYQIVMWDLVTRDYSNKLNGRQVLRKAASRLEHMPASLKYLFILIFSSIVLLYNFLYILSTVKF